MVKISILLLSYVVPVKSKVNIWQNFVAFSEYMNFTNYGCMMARFQILFVPNHNPQTPKPKYILPLNCLIFFEE